MSEIAAAAAGSRSFDERLRRVEDQLANWTRRIGKIDSDSPSMPSMDDFNFSEDELATADASGRIEWSAPFRFPNGNPRGLTWDSGSCGSLFVNSSVGFIETTGELLSFVDATEPATCWVHTASRFVKTHFRFYYRHPKREGNLQITATFSIRNAHIADSFRGSPGGSSSIDLLDFQNLRIAAYARNADSWDRCGKVIDEYHELAWIPEAGQTQNDVQMYDLNRQASQHTVVLRGRGELRAGQLVKFYVGVWAGVTLRVDACSFETFNRFDAQLLKVQAEVLEASAAPTENGGASSREAEDGLGEVR